MQGILSKGQLNLEILNSRSVDINMYLTYRRFGSDVIIGNTH